MSPEEPPRNAWQPLLVIETERRQAVARDLRRLRVEHVPLSTDGDWLRELGRRLG